MNDALGASPIIFLTLQEAQELCGVSVKTLRRRIADGRLRTEPRQHGEPYLVTVDALVEAGLTVQEKLDKAVQEPVDIVQGEVVQDLRDQLARAQGSLEAVQATVATLTAERDAEREERDRLRSLLDVESGRRLQLEANYQAALDKLALSSGQSKVIEARTVDTVQGKKGLGVWSRMTRRGRQNGD
jgi:hypothetical protein